MADGTAVVWALSANGAEPILTVGGHAAKVDTVSFNADGTRLATASDDGTVKIWNVSREGGGEWMTLPGSGAVAFSPDGRSLAAGTKGGNVFVYDAATGRMDTLVRSRTGPINAIDFDPTGSMIAIAGSDGTAWTSDVRTGVELWRVPEQPFDSPVLDVAFSPDGGTLATATFAEDHPSSLWDAVTGDRLRILPYDVGDANASHAVEFNPDGRSVAGSGFSFVRVWRLEDGSYVQIETGVVNALAFSPDGNVLASGANDGSLKLSDPRTGHELISASPNLGEFTDVAFSPDGATLATSSSDGTVRLWDGRTLEPIMMIGTMAEGRLAYSPDGSRLAHTAEDGVVRVLALGVDELIALAKARLTRSWTEDECRTYLHLNRCPSTVG
jgi:WD40 repeat protein